MSAPPRSGLGQPALCYPSPPQTGRRRASGNGDGKDMSHTKKGKLVKESASKNRARNGAGGKAKKK